MMGFQNPLPRRRRRLLSLLTLLSLLACLAVAMLWVRSDAVSHDLRYVTPDAGGSWACGVSSIRGCVVFGRVRQESRAGPFRETTGWRFDAISSQSQLAPWGTTGRGAMVQFGYQRFGFGVVARDGIPDGWVVESVAAVMVPAWFLLCCFAVLPLLSLRRLARDVWTAWRSRAGHCLSCGYDLRATPDRCPECGAVSPAAGPTIGG